MNVETLLTATKWKIIELLSQRPHSPTEMAKKIKTTTPNISQQLRLLEAYNLVKKKQVEKISPVKPRIYYELVSDYALIIMFSKGIAIKKLMKINEQQKNQIEKLIKKS